MQQPYNPDNPPAFPQAGFDGPFSQNGMSLLDWFAGQALNGMAASDPAQFVEVQKHIHTYAITAYKLADAMLMERAARAEQQKGGSDGS